MALPSNTLERRRITGLTFAGALSLALFCAGCPESACFEWTEAEGACPTQAEALPFFEEPNCHYSEIKSVDSEAAFEDSACCYTVTKWSKDEERAFICQ